MNRNLLTAYTLLLSLFVTSASAQNLLDDGNMSLADSGAQTSNSDWVLSVNFPDGIDDSAQFQTGFGNAQNTGAGGSEFPGTGAGVWFRAFEGNQGGSGEPLADATLSQSIIAPTSGDYQLSFVAGRETFFTASEFSVTLSSSGSGGSDTVDLLAAAIPNGNIGGSASTNAGGTPFEIDLTGVTMGDTLTVSGVMLGGEDAGTNPQSAFLDSFSLALVPEPSSMLLLGMGSIGMLFRRRR